jgi:hypothetical protein
MRKTYRQANDWHRDLDPGSPTTPVIKVRRDASHFIARGLWPSGFRLFHNGGLPQLERRRDDWICEILLDVNETEATSAPVRIRIHLCHRNIRTVREKYWTPASAAPILVAASDIGGLELPPSYLVWWCKGRTYEYAEMMSHIQATALPWFAEFEDPEQLEAKLMGAGLPLIGHATAIELLLTECGRKAARAYVEKFLADDAQFQIEVGRLAMQPRGKPLPEMPRAASAAFLYRLL